MSAVDRVLALEERARVWGAETEEEPELVAEHDRLTDEERAALAPSGRQREHAGSDARSATSARPA